MISTTRRAAFLIRVNWNHSVIRHFVWLLRIIWRAGGWTAYAFVGFVILFLRMPDPMDATFPTLAGLAKVFTAALVTWLLWVFVDVYQDVKRSGDHLPRLDD